jgi:hypothetical protein
VIRLRYQFVDQRRRRLATLEVGLHGSYRNLREHESGAPQLRRSGTAERVSRERPQACFETLRLIVHTALECCRPTAVDKIMA